MGDFWYRKVFCKNMLVFPTNLIGQALENQLIFHHPAEYFNGSFTYIIKTHNIISEIT
jgi:hypothetical protein